MGPTRYRDLIAAAAAAAGDFAGPAEAAPVLASWAARALIASETLAFADVSSAAKVDRLKQAGSRQRRRKRALIGLTGEILPGGKWESRG